MQQLLFILVKSLVWLVSKLPFPLLYGCSTAMYLLVFYIIGYRKKVVANNIELAFPNYTPEQVKQVRKKFYKHFCDFIFESVKSYTIAQKEVKKRFVYTNPEIVDSYYKEGKSILLWCGHYASWEWSGILNDRINHKGYAVYKPMDNKNYDGLVRYIRERFGATIVSNRQIAKTLFRDASNKVYNITLMLSDQTPRPTVAKHWDEFMGVRVPVFVGGEVLSKKLGLVNMYLHIEKIKRGYYQATIIPLNTDGIHNPYPVTRNFLNALEDQIKAKPEYYLWTHKRWKYREKAD